jgi:hypothetical protein
LVGDALVKRDGKRRVFPSKALVTKALRKCENDRLTVIHLGFVSFILDDRIAVLAVFGVFEVACQGGVFLLPASF